MLFVACCYKQCLFLLLCLDYGASFAEQESEITYTYPTPENVPGVDIVLGFKANSKDKCGGDLLKITSKGTQDFFLFSMQTNWYIALHV